MSEIEEIPTKEITVTVCTKCGLIVSHPHNEYNCPKSTSSKSWREEYLDRDWVITRGGYEILGHTSND